MTKRQNNGRPHAAQKTQDWVHWIPLKTKDELVFLLQ